MIELKLESHDGNIEDSWESGTWSIPMMLDGGIVFYLIRFSPDPSHEYYRASNNSCTIGEVGGYITLREGLVMNHNKPGEAPRLIKIDNKIIIKRLQGVFDEILSSSEIEGLNMEQQEILKNAAESLKR